MEKIKRLSPLRGGKFAGNIQGSKSNLDSEKDVSRERDVFIVNQLYVYQKPGRKKSQHRSRR